METTSTAALSSMPSSWGTRADPYRSASATATATANTDRPAAR
ncbi:hypothetical protein AB0M32_02090 [Streptomyces sp. NPDC051985]